MTPPPPANGINISDPNIQSLCHRVPNWPSLNFEPPTRPHQDTCASKERSKLAEKLWSQHRFHHAKTRETRSRYRDFNLWPKFWPLPDHGPTSMCTLVKVSNLDSKTHTSECPWSDEQTNRIPANIWSTDSGIIPNVTFRNVLVFSLNNLHRLPLSLVLFICPSPVLISFSLSLTDRYHWLWYTMSAHKSPFDRDKVPWMRDLTSIWWESILIL